jgi:trk system potassium uptake protein TrkH
VKQFFAIQRILGLLLMVFSLTMVPPAVVGWAMGDTNLMPFLDGFLVIVVLGAAIWLPVHRVRRELRIRDGFMVVVMFWVGLGLAGAVPFLMSPDLKLSMANAVFESISGLTTTGATVIVGLDYLPYSILFYRQELQWLGGMGIIVLAIAIMPMLGVGGMQLYRAETPGPVKDNKLTPRIAGTAKALWYVYLGLTVSCALGYWAAGMSLFDAVCHAFSTVSTGGSSTHDESMGYFHSPLIEMVSVVFMLLAGVNFGLHFMAWHHRSLREYFADAEFKTYLRLMFLVAAISTLYLYFMNVFDNFGSALHHGIFQTVSIFTSTGFTTAAYDTWPGFLPVLLLFTSFVGGCASSTGGGMKVIRFLLLLKQGVREVMRLVHPSAQVVVKLGRLPVPPRVLEGVWGFFAAYIGVFVIMMLLLMASGLDQVTAFSAVAASINNMGPGLGDVGTNYQGINDFAKWILSLAMLLGRLEIFPLLVLLSPTFWRR